LGTRNNILLRAGQNPDIAKCPHARNGSFVYGIDNGTSYPRDLLCTQNSDDMRRTDFYLNHIGMKMIRKLNKLGINTLISVTAFALTISCANAQQNTELTRPANPIANDLGIWESVGGWAPNVRTDQLGFTSTDASKGYNYYDTCGGTIELWHPQHVVRLPNKDGRGYFMVAQSDSGGGFITLMQTNPGQLDPQTDLVKPPAAARSEVGKYIWASAFPSNGSNPIGSWNHPGKMEVIGGLLVVAAQNWTASLACKSGTGSSIDALLFYDVSDPEFPKYIGMINEDELGVNEISTLAIVKTSSGQYLLNAGGDGRFSTWIADEVKPTIETWTKLEMPSSFTFSGQHGMNFNSYQKMTVVSRKSPPAGTERIMYFDSSGKDDTISFVEFVYNSTTRLIETKGSLSYPVELIGADRHWDSDSLYVTNNGQPIIYSMESEHGQHGVLFQVHSRPIKIGNLVTVGTDGTLYKSTNPTTSFAQVPNSGNAKGVTVLSDGRIVALGTDGHLYVAPSLGEPFAVVPNTGNAVAVTALSDGRILAVGTDSYLYVAPGLGQPFAGVPNSGNAIAVTDLSDGRIVVVGTDGNLYVAPSLGQPFSSVPNSGNTKGVAALSDGGILSVGTNGRLYVAPKLGDPFSVVLGSGHTVSVATHP
jgi:hypothetical protein